MLRFVLAFSQMMVGVLELFRDAEPAWRLHTVIPHETHVFAVATITIVES
jgi:hypothetical protein